MDAKTLGLMELPPVSGTQTLHLFQSREEEGDVNQCMRQWGVREKDFVSALELERARARGKMWVFSLNHSPSHREPAIEVWAAQSLEALMEKVLPSKKHDTQRPLWRWFGQFFAGHTLAYNDLLSEGGYRGLDEVMVDARTLPGPQGEVWTPKNTRGREGLWSLTPPGTKTLHALHALELGALLEEAHRTHPVISLHQRLETTLEVSQEPSRPRSRGTRL